MLPTCVPICSQWSIFLHLLMYTRSSWPRDEHDIWQKSNTVSTNPIKYFTVTH